MWCFVLMAVVQILLESLPVSSSGHLRLIEEWARYYKIPWCILTNDVEYLLHGPTLFVLGVYFLSSWWPMLANMYRYRWVLMRFAWLGFIAEVITVGWYGVFMYWGFCGFPLPLGFFITAMALMSLLWVCPSRSRLTWQGAVILGMAQGIALLPGVSRLGITYVTGCWLGLSPQRSFAFSCALQWPLIVAGFVKGLVVLDVNLKSFLIEQIWLVLAVISIASGGAYCLLWYSEYQARKGRLWIFGMYMLIPLCISLWLS